MGRFRFLYGLFPMDSVLGRHPRMDEERQCQELDDIAKNQGIVPGTG